MNGINFQVVAKLSRVDVWNKQIQKNTTCILEERMLKIFELC